MSGEEQQGMNPAMHLDAYAVYVGNLPPRTLESTVRFYFEVYGEIHGIYIREKKQFDSCIAFVHYRNQK